MPSRGNFPPPSEMLTSGFDTSEDEDEADYPPFEIHWLELSYCGYPDVGLSIVPGCKVPHKRRLSKDLDALDVYGIRAVFVLCTQFELFKYGVADILNAYDSIGIQVHHYPILETAYIPSPDVLMEILEDLKVTLGQGKRTLIHGIGGLGRTCCVAACLLQYLDDNISAHAAIELVRKVRGRGAIQTVKQFNLIHDFKDLYQEYMKSNKQDSELRCISR